MSLWFFLTDWFAGAPTTWTLLKRSLINAAWAGGIIVVMAACQAPAEYAAIIFFGVFVVNCVMFVAYHLQRNRMRD